MDIVGAFRKCFFFTFLEQLEKNYRKIANKRGNQFQFLLPNLEKKNADT